MRANCNKRIYCAEAVILSVLRLVQPGWSLSQLHSQAESQAEATQVSCSPERPVTEIGSEVRVRAFVQSATQHELQYSWTATAGRIQGNSTQGTWSLKGALSGRYQATVTVNSSGKELAECSLQVIVIEAQRSGTKPSRESARSFLVKGQEEDAGYGLYSYLLFGSPPTEASRVRYLTTIEAYMKLLLPLRDLQDNAAHSKLNITYLPLKVAPPSSPTSAWLLENYDFGRARILLDGLPGNHRLGPYFISALKPLSSADATPNEYLFQDLSTVPTEPRDLLSWWILEFQNQAAQERFWEPSTAQHLALRLRTTISVLALGLPQVQNQLQAWIVWAKRA